MTSERKLRKLRTDALRTVKELKDWDSEQEFTHQRRKQAEIILILTQELLDYHLLKRSESNDKRLI
jgi:hypothetical protein